MGGVGWDLGCGRGMYGVEEGTAVLGRGPLGGMCLRGGYGAEGWERVCGVGYGAWGGVGC